MYKWLVIVTFLLISSCQNNNNSDNETNNLNDCLSQNKVELTEDKVKSLDFNDGTIKQSGMIKQGEKIGFSFTASAGDKLEYKTEDNNICIDIYAPNNQLVNDINLPLDGRYLIEVYLPQGSQSFQISFSLNQDNNLSDNNEDNYRWNLTDFPKSSCGDEKPSDSSLYPLDFYPVNIPYNPEYLDIAINNFCQDSYQKRDKLSGDKIIQVASFLSKDQALSFAQFISEKIPNAYVGEPTKVYQ
ncbi:hypothetical protein [Geminocystis sp. NIES-3709]|uniref:hypothetical protein n=1 Tax=Geminocystis sp. NIES-3709 TaxID=1617448 RepID=UPI0005FC693F|nr:hypothetical protein [Geminocystis sp. NIES-3709]BAQ64818.1 hypothetical protein GM3709_1583 [Geminocystis sp. NIES-3709]